MNIVILLILIFILISLIINFYSFLILKWKNDYSSFMENVCNELNISELEYETYRHNMYRFLYNIDNNSYNNSISIFKNTYYITISLITIILIAYIRNFKKIRKEDFFMLFIFLTFYILYIYIGNKILKNYDSLNNLLKDDKSDIFKYAKIYKILNAIMYINDFKNNKIPFSDINTKVKKLDDILKNNIATYENISNTAKIIELKRISYNYLDFIKYITLDTSSPFFFKKYFKNIYINKKQEDELNTDIIKD